MAAPTREQLEAQEEKLSKLLGQVRKLTGGGKSGRTIEQIRADDRANKKEARREKSTVPITVSSNSLRRRTRLEKNITKWLRFYYPHVFVYDFTDNQGAIVRAILTAAKEGGDQAIAAPRGDGKTSIVEGVIVYCVLTGILSFPVIFSATGDDAERILANIKRGLEENERLVEDYNEVCGPAAALDGRANRATGQEVAGNIGKATFDRQRTRIKWSGREIVFPTIKAKGSRATGQIIATRGLDAAVRGIRYGVMRPDLAVIDDPETRDIACSDDDRQRIKLGQKVDQDIAGCAGQTRRLSRVVLSTLMSRKSLSARYTDPKQQPSFRGKRFRYMVEPPDRQDLWDEFVSLQEADWAAEPRTQAAHDFYMDNRKTMDAGAVVGNPHRRGDDLEVSAIEAYYVEVARLGQEAVSTEYDNDPPEEDGPLESGITPHRVQCQVSGHDRRIVPTGCSIVTQAIDVRKVALHCVVRAWQPNAVGYTIDYGIQEVWGTTKGTDDGLQQALFRALHARAEDIEQNPYTTPDGEIVPIALTLVDARWQTDAICDFCKFIGLDKWKPAMGIGKSAGCAETNFRPPLRPTADKKVGDHWFLSRRPKGVWLTIMETDYWKAWEHDRWMTDPGKPGSMQLFGDPTPDHGRMSHDQKGHHSYAHHICSEVEVEEPVKGKGLVRKWKNKSNNNHYFDASYMADVAANMKGIALATHAPLVPTQTAALPPGGWFAGAVRR